MKLAVICIVVAALALGQCGSPEGEGDRTPTPINSIRLVATSPAIQNLPPECTNGFERALCSLFSGPYVVCCERTAE